MMVGSMRGSIFQPGGAPRWPLRRHSILVAATAALAVTLPAQARRSPLVHIAHLEDTRPHGAPLDTLRAYLSHREPGVRAAAVRAIGRLQRPEELTHIYGRLSDVPAVRLEAINAVGQALRGPVQPGSEIVRGALDSLVGAAQHSRALPQVIGAAARTIGRLPHGDSLNGRRAASAIVALNASALPQAEGVLHGLYALARARRAIGNLPDDALAVARAALTRPGASEGAARVRRLAMLTLNAAGAATPELVTAAMRDADDQVRRLAAVALATRADAGRAAQLNALLKDPSAIVRHEAVRAWRALAASEGCGPLIGAVGDANPHVMLAAIDGMTAACRDRQRVADTLLSLIDAFRSDNSTRATGRPGWHVHAHALVALARTDTGRAAPIVRREARDATFWGVKAYVARAAQVLRDTAVLRSLAGPGHGNPREVALGALAAVGGHAFDDLFLAALDAPEYHVVAEAAQALKGTPNAARAVDALARTLDRLTAEDRDNNRDPRVAILERLEELGDRALAARMERLLADRDTAVAIRARGLLTRWNGRSPEVTRRHRGTAEDIAPLMTGEWRARVTMRRETGGGVFELRLFPREAPYTVARFVRLSRAGYFNGLTLHRVEPGFVTQGGSPAANEYVGDGPFMRDELGLRSHTRGTFGISTRGRDTGDAQFFLNLTDNFRLDHDYTVFGEILRGRDVAEGILEADVIESIVILPPAR